MLFEDDAGRTLSEEEVNELQEYEIEERGIHVADAA